MRCIVELLNRRACEPCANDCGVSSASPKFSGAKIRISREKKQTRLHFFRGEVSSAAAKVRISEGKNTIFGFRPARWNFRSGIQRPKPARGRRASGNSVSAGDVLRIFRMRNDAHPPDGDSPLAKRAGKCGRIPLPHAPFALRSFRRTHSERGFRSAPKHRPNTRLKRLCNSRRQKSGSTRRRRKGP